MIFQRAVVEVREQLQRHQASMQKDNVVLKNSLRHNAQSMILVEEECQVSFTWWIDDISYHKPCPKKPSDRTSAGCC
jgi:hypothetical protein